MTSFPTNRSVKFAAEHETAAKGQNSDEEDEKDRPGRQFNKFQLLNLVEDTKVAQESDEIDVGSDVEAEQNKAASSDDDSQRPDPKQISQNAAKGKQRRRRNKSKSSKNQQAKDANNDFDFETNQLFVQDVEKGSRDGPILGVANSHLQLLKVDTRNLLPENEVKRMFGKSVLREERAAKGKHHVYVGSSSVQRSRFVSSGFHDPRMTHLSPGPKMELDELLNKQPNEQPPQSDAKSQMSGKKGKRGRQEQTSDTQPSLSQPLYFKFVHNKTYQSVHATFLEAAHRGHSEAIVRNLSLYPAHVESLIQLSDMIRLSEDYKTASDFIERALLIFERGFHQKFNVTQANCRLSYKRPENRTFFITIFKHIAYCNRRGLRRTPLEYTKLLLSLDPDNDPLFAALLIDFYAIRSEHYDYLIEFISKWFHLAKLPNINFSLALAHFMKSRNTKQSKTENDKCLRMADECLHQALLRYPNFIIPLLDACMAEPDASLKRCNYFDYSVYGNKYKTVPEPVDLLVAIYVQRTHMIWKTKPVMSWLERNVAELVEKFSKNEIVITDQPKDYWASFQGPSPRNLLRHIVLSDLSVKVPPSATTGVLLDIDPYPPESLVSYTLQPTSHGAPSTSASGSTTTSQPLGFPSLFIRSFLPSFSLIDQSNSSTAATAPTNNAASSSAGGQRLGSPSSHYDQISGLTEELERELAQQAAMPADADPINLENVQTSIQNVLSSLTSLLMGTEVARADEQPPDGDQDN